MSLLSIGSVAYDIIELPRKEPVKVLGGSATWFCTAASLFSSPNLVAVVGDDFANEDINFLRERKIGLDGLERANGSTFHWHGRYHEDLISRDSLRTDLGVFADFVPKVPDAWHSPDVLFLGNIKPDLQALVLRQVGDVKFVGLDTIELWIETCREDFEALLPSVDLLFVNDDEVRQISLENNVLVAAKKVLSMGAKAVVVKRGEHGAILVSPDGLALFPGFPVENIVDPTGAGDSFAGGTLAYLDLIQDFGFEAVKRALVVGTVMGSFCVQGFGPRALAEVKMTDFRQRVAKYLDFVDFNGKQLLTDLNF